MILHLISFLYASYILSCYLTKHKLFKKLELKVLYFNKTI